MATIGVYVAGAVSTGGLAALAAKMSLKAHNAVATISNSSERDSENVGTNC
jgi:hypothetical protein